SSQRAGRRSVSTGQAVEEGAEALHGERIRPREPLVAALCSLAHPRCTLGRGVLQAEDEHEGVVDGTQLARVEASGWSAAGRGGGGGGSAGRKLGGRWRGEVGAMSTVERSRNSSAWTITA